MSAYPKVFLAQHRDKRLRRGHPWVFSNEITQVEGQPGIGSLVEVCRMDGRFLGTGFYHPHSLIAVRLLRTTSGTVDHAFFRSRLLQAIRSRKLTMKGADAMRLVHGESDGLPGLIVDQYAKALAVQINSAGMDMHTDLIADILQELLEPEVIVLRNDSPLRTLEGLEQAKSVLRGDADALTQTIHEGEIAYAVDVLQGQKTGFYLDQRENRFALRRFINEGDHVFDGFCNEGGFALHAAKAGANRVTAVDVSAEVLKRAAANADANGLGDAIQFRQADLMKQLPTLLSEGLYDVINLDPPNFTRSKKNVSTARQAYRRLHQTAIEHLKPGGILATSSCSHHITEETFLETVLLAAERSGKRLKTVFRGSHPTDHPVLLGMPETEYLKFFVFELL